MIDKREKLVYNSLTIEGEHQFPKESKMKRYKVVYEGFIFEGDTDGLNIRYAERYEDVSWMLNAYDGVEIIDMFYC